eukprot:GDKI01016780.1.p1 GENE.GDKI01016780.1~~GDKI01016780.1.p1  ORF type:complete len:206 (-),score=10.76 GDKI01016780.1:160-696(-)
MWHNIVDVFGFFGIPKLIHEQQIYTLVNMLLNRNPDLQHVREITLVGHSRGAIQACFAVQHLKSMKRSNGKDLQFASISLISFGAPISAIDHGVTKYLTLVEMNGDPIPGWTGFGFVVKFAVSATIFAFPGYAKYKLKYDATVRNLANKVDYHYIDFYADFITNNHPCEAFEGFVRVN